MTKTIVITGVSRGLGRVMTEGMIAAGHTVLGCARSPQAIAELQQQYAAPHDFAVVDVAKDAEVKDWCDRLVQRYGAPDLVVNNAAIINELAPLWEIPVDEFDRLIDINIKGVVNVIRHLVPAMVAQQRGIIVNFSSGWGRSTSPEVASYCASKWAIEGLSQAMAQELPAGMAAIALNPGIINTDMLQICFGDDASAYPKAQAWGKRAVPFLLKLTSRDNGRSLTVPS
ncbi:SDR family oxidoreductase [Leptolyngbya sp. AN02str]|uniref:SDR family oxidoreductase n=1 Tax=Leptolyngbya sp. AN02str TaxID=3423363 RepID=UPI003D313A5C